MSFKAAVITDVHANLPALEAALAAIDLEGCDVIYCLGDVVGIGPYPAECLNLLLGLPSARFIMGNHDAWFAFGLPTPRPSWMSDGEKAHHQWTHAQLSPEFRDQVARWPYVLEENLHELKATFCHYALDETARGFKPVVPAPSETDLDELFAPTRSSVVFYGHVHAESDFTSNAQYVNPGALGCSSDSMARFVIAEVNDDGTMSILHHAAPYNRVDLIQQLEARQVPERAMILKSFYGLA